MPIDGDAKKKYQKDYMAKKRSNVRSNKGEGLTDENVRPMDEAPSTEARILEIQKELADPALVEKIEEAAGIMKDRVIRYERAQRHHWWTNWPNATPMDLPEYVKPKLVASGEWKGIGFCVDCNENVSKGDNCCKGCFKAS